MFEEMFKREKNAPNANDNPNIYKNFHATFDGTPEEREKIKEEVVRQWCKEYHMDVQED